jgi:hypothetical protein
LSGEDEHMLEAVAFVQFEIGDERYYTKPQALG